MKNPAHNITFQNSLYMMTIWLGLLLLAACGDNRPGQAISPQPASQSTPLITLQPTQLSNPSVTAIARTPEEEDNIREALLRYIFAEEVNSPYPKSQFYCIGLGTTMHKTSFLQDPPQAFLTRFQGNIPTLTKASDCVVSQEKVQDKNTGETGMIWALNSINWLGANEAELEISYCRAIMFIGGKVYQLKKENRAWKVTSSTLTLVA